MYDNEHIIPYLLQLKCQISGKPKFIEKFLKRFLDDSISELPNLSFPFNLDYFERKKANRNSRNIGQIFKRDLEMPKQVWLQNLIVLFPT